MYKNEKQQYFLKSQVNMIWVWWPQKYKLHKRVEFWSCTTIADI